MDVRRLRDAVGRIGERDVDARFSPIAVSVTVPSSPEPFCAASA